MNIELEMAQGLIQALKPSPVKDGDSEYIQDWKRIYTSALQTAIETLELWGEMEGRKIAQFHGENI